MYRVLITAGVAAALLAVVPSASADRKDSLKKFQDASTKAKSKIAAGGPTLKDPQVTVAPNVRVPVLSSKFSLDGTTPPDIKLGVKIWAELRDGPAAGQFVNPANYRWAPGERFWLWLESCAPVQLAIFQAFPDSVDGAKQVVPDEKFPDSFKTVYPGERFKFPIPFKMDPDTKTEYMAIVVSRTDVEHLPLNNYVPPPPGTPVTPPTPTTPPPPAPGTNITINNEVQVAMALNQGVVYKGTLGGAQKAAMTHMFKTAAKKGMIDGQSTKFSLAPDGGGGSAGTTPVPPGPGGTPPDEVALLLFGAGKIGMQQLEMNKRRQ